MNFNTNMQTMGGRAPHMAKYKVSHPFQSSEGPEQSKNNLIWKELPSQEKYHIKISKYIKFQIVWRNTREQTLKACNVLHYLVLNQ
jgi:hypothetical protein